ncbi:MAG: hypothetical protein MJ247_04745 [Alphaproteobacteria bacterium]|nr:hypothetical protein [Alphaproteobacteria bacterium]
MKYIKIILIVIFFIVSDNSFAKDLSELEYYNLVHEFFNKKAKTEFNLDKSIRPTAEVKFDFSVPTYEQVPVVNCGHVNAGGCTHWKHAYQLMVNCLENKIYIRYFNLPNFPKVTILDRYEMGTKIFDMTIKHEMTHVQLFRKTYKKLVPKMAAFAVKEYEDMLMSGKSCSEITSSISNLISSYSKEIDYYSKQQQDLIDGTEHYNYQALQNL